MNPAADLVAMQAAFLAVEAFLVGLYVQRRFAIEDGVRKYRQDIQRSLIAGDRRNAELIAAELSRLRRHLNPVSMGLDRPVLRRAAEWGSLIVLLAFASVYLILWWALMGAVGDGVPVEVLGRRGAIDITEWATTFLTATTIVVAAAGAALLQGRAKVIQQEMEESAMSLLFFSLSA